MSWLDPASVLRRRVNRFASTHGLAALLENLPIVGVAPIMVNWFVFDWQSKAAVVVVMVFFLILVNTVQGLLAADAMQQRDLMMQTLFKLRLPAATPVVFNGLKIATTLALIGAIVAEHFSSPTIFDESWMHQLLVFD